MKKNGEKDTYIIFFSYLCTNNILPYTEYEEENINLGR